MSFGKRPAQALVVIFVALGHPCAGQGFVQGIRRGPMRSTLEVDRDEVLAAARLNTMEHARNDRWFNLFVLEKDYARFESRTWNDPGVADAQARGRGFHGLYAQGLKLYTEDGLSPETKVKALRDAFVAGLMNDEEKTGDLIGLSIGLAARGALGARVLRDAKARHARVWERLVPLCEAIAGPDTPTSPLEFTIEFRRGERDCHFLARNASGNELHNVTLIVKPTFGNVDPETRNSFVFVPLLANGDSIEFQRILPHPASHNYARRISNALDYSIYSDELRVKSRTVDLSGWTRVGAKVVVYKSRFLGS